MSSNYPSVSVLPQPTTPMASLSSSSSSPPSPSLFSSPSSLFIHSRTTPRLIPLSTTCVSTTTCTCIKPYKCITPTSTCNRRTRRRPPSLNWNSTFTPKHNNNHNHNSNSNNTNNNNNNKPPDIPSHLSIASSLSSHLPSLKEDSTEQTRILFLISDTGGGHRASAQALASAFEQLYPSQVHSVITDFWTEIVGRPFTHFPEHYSFLAKNPPLWRAAWNYGKFPITRRLTEEFSNFVGNRNFRNALLKFQPHLIVSVHPLTQFIPLRVLKSLYKQDELKDKIPFITVCTDLGGAHPTWFHRDVDLCFIPSIPIRDIALKCGLKNNQLRLIGLPVRPSFWKHSLTNKNETRHKLNLCPEGNVILIVGGGDGVGGVYKITTSIANKLSKSSKPVSIVVICGKNEGLRNKLLLKNDWPLGINIVVNGFVNNMSEWMTAADILVSKAGPGTIAEALIRGLPIVLSGFLPGQEAPNVDLVTEAGVGDFQKEPAEIARVVADWVERPGELERRADLARRMGRPNATYDIVREIAKLTDLAQHDSDVGVGVKENEGTVPTRTDGQNSGSVV